MIMNDSQAIQDQLADAHEAAHHLTIRAEQDAERDEQDFMHNCSEDNWKEFIR
jgi:hypothetical protein